MSTNDSGWGLESLPPGLPDPEVLARLAAGFFGALPGAREVAEGLAAGAPLAPGVAPPGRLPQRLPLNAAPAAAPRPPSVPAGAGAADAPASPGFSFLREARPIFGGAEATPEPGIAAPPPIPSPAAAPIQPAAGEGPPTPSVPSGAGHRRIRHSGFLVSGGSPAAVFLSAVGSGASPRVRTSGRPARVRGPEPRAAGLRRGNHPAGFSDSARARERPPPGLAG